MLLRCRTVAGIRADAQICSEKAGAVKVGSVSLRPLLTAPGDPLTSLFKPVQPPTAFEQTVERLATAIKLGFLPPGGQLPPERELARQLEISRTTLRQALTALTQSGLVTTSRGRRGGTFVADPLPLPPRPRRVFEEDELRAFLDQRLAIETGVAIRAAERAEPGELDALVLVCEDRKSV